MYQVSNPFYERLLVMFGQKHCLYPGKWDGFISVVQPKYIAGHGWGKIYLANINQALFMAGLFL